MREIKFRGKRADGKDKDDNFVIGDYLYDNVTGKHFIIVDFCETIYTEAHDSCIAIEIKKETRGQYIGLKDKNGVDIYDGDELHLYYYIQDEDKQIWIDKDVTVKLCNNGIFYGYLGVSNDGDDYFTLQNYSDRQVIGNIHDK